MASFDGKAYGPVIAEILQETRLMPLGPGQPNQSAHAKLDALTPEKAFAHAKIRDRNMANACCAALWLYHDYLDQSHTVSQDIDTTTGSYWHGILHRREPDYGNAKYWFRRVGSHAIFPTLVSALPQTAPKVLTQKGSWDPMAFIDLCEKAAGNDASLEDVCRQIQQCEWEILFDYSYRNAIGDSSKR
jgi:hypothetical protein